MQLLSWVIWRETVYLAPGVCEEALPLSFNSASCFVIKKEGGGLITCGPVVESRVVKHLGGHSKHGSTVHYASGSKGNWFPTRTCMFLRLSFIPLAV